MAGLDSRPAPFHHLNDDSCQGASGRSTSGTTSGGRICRSFRVVREMKDVMLSESKHEADDSANLSSPEISPLSAPIPRMCGGALSGVEKNIEKWRAVPNYGRKVESTRFIPTKTFSRHTHHGHTITTFLNANPRVALIIDLSSEVNAYDVDRPGVGYVKLSSISKQLPENDCVEQFVEIVQRFESEHVNDNALIGVHCHYGFNRTGFLVSAYIALVRSVGADVAMSRFETARPPGIRHQHFKEELRRRYQITNKTA